MQIPARHTKNIYFNFNNLYLNIFSIFLYISENVNDDVKP